MESTARRSDKWIPWYFVAFFVVLAALDGIFVYVAVSTQTGVVTQHPYEKGLAYNRTIADAEAQEKLGWQGRIDFTQPLLTFTLKDRTGSAITQAKATAYFSRATQQGYDFSTPLPGNADGVYSGSVAFPLNGQWDVNIAVVWNNTHYQKHARILVR